jgi:hypothetical protein
VARFSRWSDATRRYLLFFRAARLERARIIVPASVVAEIWCDPPRHQSVPLLEAAQQIRVLDDRHANAIGGLLGARPNDTNR